MYPAPTCSSLETLGRIWNTAFQSASIDPEANFFDLGGTPELAIKIFSELRKSCGREVSPLLIYAAPTIAQLAKLLDQDSTPPVPPILLLRNGRTDSPIYVCHGLGSSVFELFEMVKRLPKGPAVYGLQAKGSDGIEEPCDTIEAMAEHFLRAIRKKQAGGPYSLIGYSLGGLITLEMVRQIEMQGESVALHVMIDSYPHFTQLPFLRRVRLLCRRAVRRVSGRKNSSNPFEAAHGTKVMQHVYAKSELALRRFQPTYSAKPVRFIRAAKLSDFPANPHSAWGRWLPNLLVETVPGDHLDLLRINVNELSAALSRYLQETPKREC